METYESFLSWTQLLNHVAAGYALLYQAPMDYRPSRVTALLRKDGLLYVIPTWGDADPFIAGAEHLTRFRRYADRVNK